MKKIRKMGSFKQILGMMPGIPSEIRNAEIDEKQLFRIDAIITSMTKEERLYCFHIASLILLFQKLIRL